jgi:N6-adenosine-specific RNA methylase IME4
VKGSIPAVKVKATSTLVFGESYSISPVLDLAFNMGHTFRAATEHALIGTRGSVKKLIRDHSQRNVSLDPQLEHSAKPETLQDRLERMVDAPRLELFARRSRRGWTCIGNEAPATMGQDIFEWSGWAP